MRSPPDSPPAAPPDCRPAAPRTITEHLLRWRWQLGLAVGRGLCRCGGALTGAGWSLRAHAQAAWFPPAPRRPGP